MYGDYQLTVKLLSASLTFTGRGRDDDSACLCCTVAGVLGWCPGLMDAGDVAHYHHVLLLPVLSARGRKVDALHQMGNWHPRPPFLASITKYA